MDIKQFRVTPGEKVDLSKYATSVEKRYSDEELYGSAGPLKESGFFVTFSVFVRIYWERKEWN